jgi:hypothetical protein
MAVDHKAFRCALIALGIDPSTVQAPEAQQPEPVREPFRPLDDVEWRSVSRHIVDAVALMRPPSAARAFIDAMLLLQHTRLSSRFLDEAQESVRQRALRWSLASRWEHLSQSLHAAGELDETRLAAFRAIAEDSRRVRERILGVRAARMNERTEG